MSAAVLASLFTDEQLSFCEELPKIELHAHLNGSIRDSTIRYWIENVWCLEAQNAHGSHCKRERPAGNWQSLRK